jgi:hypothetical protein
MKGGTLIDGNNVEGEEEILSEKVRLKITYDVLLKKPSNSCAADC